MTKPIIRIHDLLTNEVIDREMNDIEFAEYEADQVLEAQRRALEPEVFATEEERLAAEEVKAQQKEALLTRLGITADEVKLLLGGN